MPGLSRRRILIALGWGAAGITAVAGGAGWALMPTLPPRNAPTHADAAAWLSLRPDGVFELYSSRAEMGQGISMGLRQVAADELGVGLDHVRLVQPDTSLVPVARSTVGSDAMRETGVLVARAAAALACAILREAAQRSGLSVADLKLASDRVVFGRETVLTFEELGTGAPLLVTAEDVETATPELLGDPANRREVGRAHHATTLGPARAAADEALILERRLSDLVNAAYGLTPEEVKLMWDTAPPRMPFTL